MWMRAGSKRERRARWRVVGGWVKNDDDGGAMFGRGASRGSRAQLLVGPARWRWARRDQRDDSIRLRPSRGSPSSEACEAWQRQAGQAGEAGTDGGRAVCADAGTPRLLPVSRIWNCC